MTGINVGSLLFGISINDLDMNKGGTISKFTDGTKLSVAVDNEENSLRVLGRR